MNIDTLRGQVEAVDAEIRAMHMTEDGELREFTPEEQEAFDAKRAERARLVALYERHEAIASAAQLPGRVESPAGPQVIRKVDPLDVIEDRSAKPSQLADAATRMLEDKVESPEDMAHVRGLMRRHATDRRWVREMVLRARPEYTEAFAKMVSGRAHLLTEEERTALSTITNANGAFLLPTHLDPTVILSGSGTSNAVRAISRVVTLTEGKTWEGITSAGITASFDAELTEVSDDSPTFANPTIDVHKAQAFAQGSIEAFADIEGLSGELLRMFADAKDVLEGTMHATGSGTNQPWGIYTALDANTNVEITSTTAATIGEVDIHSVYRQVPVRFRSRSTWLGHPLFLLAVKRLGTAVSSAYSGDLTQPVSDRILGRPVVESDDAPSAQTTTALDNTLVLGDFSNYVIVDKPGSMAVEYIPHLFNTSNNLPDGRRGVYVHWRTGADSVLDTAFRLLQDKTSA